MVNKNIKLLSDFKEEIHRCSKCGLCQAVCPLYEATKNECSVSRGQFIMLNGVIEGTLELNKNVNKYLDLCLKCNKCSGFCPSDIDVTDILLTAKYEYFKTSIEGKIYSFLESKPVFNTILNSMHFITSIFTPKIKSERFDTKAVYFGGCISKLRPDVKNFVIKLLNKLEIEVLNTDLNCCGMPFLTTGNLERFQEQAEENLTKLPNNFNYLITDCASCEWAWGQYQKYIKDEALKEKLKTIKFVNIYDLIADSGLSFKSNKPIKLTYHKPCHETHSESIEKIIKNLGNTEYVELEDKDLCCGFGSFEHPKTLFTNYPILKNKKEKIKKTDSDYILTSCVGCLFSLSMMSLFSKQKSRRLISFLKMMD